MHGIDTKSLRGKLKISQQKLADETGIPRDRIAQWERNKGTPKVSDYNKLVNFFTKKGVINEDLNTTTSPISIEPKTNSTVPFHQDIVLTAGAVEVYNPNRPSGATYINLGDAFSDATGAMQVSGHSMYPNYENGCIIGYREVHDKSYFLYGEAYIIGTKEYQFLKRVQKSDKEGHILLISDNDEPGKNGRRKYEEVELDVDKIKFMAIVIGKISRTQMKMAYSLQD